jgi:hypothetical protein
LKQRVHAVLLTHGKPCPVSDLFGVRGRQLLVRLGLPEPWQSTIEASLRLIDELDREISECERELRRLGADHRYVPFALHRAGDQLGARLHDRRGDRRHRPLRSAAEARRLQRVSARASTNRASATCAARSPSRDPLPALGAQFRRQRRARVLPGGACGAGRVQATRTRRLVRAGDGSRDLMISDEEVEKLAAAARVLPPNTSVYLEQDFVMNLLETVLDYMLQTEVVVKALERFRENRWNEVRTLDDLERLLARFPEDQAGNTALAQYLWGYNFWTRAQQLREFVRYFRSIGVVDQERLKQWAWTSTFKKDFEGRVKGLGPAVYQWLVMRQGVDTVKPDVHLRRFAEAAVGRKLTDQDVIELTSKAAARIGVKAFELDWRIWEASRGGALPYPTARA